MRSLALEAHPRPEYIWWSLAGRPGKPDTQLEEVGTAAREIRRFEGLIMHMQRSGSCPLSTADNHVWSNAFTFPGCDGQILVIVDTDIGTWPCQSRHMFRDDDAISIDNDGNLTGYSPRAESRIVSFSGASNQSVFDLSSGEEVKILRDGVRNLRFAPGAGRFLFVGTVKEAKRLHSLVHD
jgi:hypothetical protein